MPEARSIADSILESLIPKLERSFTRVQTAHVVDLSPCNFNLNEQLQKIPDVGRYRKVQLVHHMSMVDRYIVARQTPQNLEEAVSEAIQKTIELKYFGQSWIKDEPWDGKKSAIIVPALLITPDAA